MVAHTCNTRTWETQAGGVCVFKADPNYAVSGNSFLKQSKMRVGKGREAVYRNPTHV